MEQAIRNRLLSAECFLWDFDGCFADTEEVHFLAYREAFLHFGHTLNEADYYPSFTHLGEGVQREISLHGLQISADEITRLKSESYRRMIKTGPVGCFPETLQIVRCMHQRGARVAIASNSSEDEIRTVLQMAAFPGDEVDLIVGKNEHLRKKPAPDIFLNALQRLGMTASQAVVFEDSNRGLQAAAAAGCQALWVRTRYNQNLTSGEPYMGHLSHAEILKILSAS